MKVIFNLSKKPGTNLVEYPDPAHSPSNILFRDCDFDIEPGKIVAEYTGQLALTQYTPRTKEIKKHQLLARIPRAKLGAMVSSTVQDVRGAVKYIDSLPEQFDLQDADIKAQLSSILSDFVARGFITQAEADTILY